MNAIIRAPLHSAFWVGAFTVIVGLWLYRNYGQRLPRLPGGAGANG